MVRIAWCAGVSADLLNLRAHYASFWREGLLDDQRQRALAAGVFAFFAQAAPAITFAGFLSERTNGACGVAETLLGMGLCGLLFAFAAGQPLVLVGTTGPVCLLIAALSDVAAARGLDFRGSLFVTCVWAAAFHAVLAAAGAPRAFVRRVTPFSGEVFGALVSLVYVVEGASALASLARAPSGALSLGVGLGCAASSFVLTSARKWRVLPNSDAAALVRGVIADYGLAISVIAAAAVQFAPALADARAALPLLPVPSRGYTPSESRPWVDAAAIASFPAWAAAAAAGPGAVLTALLYFDHQISAMLSQEPRFRLRKPPAYDLDFLLLGASLVLTAVLGLPPVYGLLPQAPLHVRALAKIAPPSPGQPTEDKWEGVCETRWSAALQSALLLVLLSTPLLRLLGALPQGVLAGMLIYLGVAGLAGSGIVRRAIELASGRKQWIGAGGAASRRDAAALSFLQVALVGLTFGITRSAASLAFPLAIVALVPLRTTLLPRLFGDAAICALDPPDWGASALGEADKEAGAAPGSEGSNEAASVRETAGEMS